MAGPADRCIGSRPLAAQRSDQRAGDQPQFLAGGDDSAVTPGRRPGIADLAAHRAVDAGDGDGGPALAKRQAVHGAERRRLVPFHQRDDPRGEQRQLLAVFGAQMLAGRQIGLGQPFERDVAALVSIVG